MSAPSSGSGDPMDRLERAVRYLLQLYESQRSSLQSLRETNDQLADRLRTSEARVAMLEEKLALAAGVAPADPDARRSAEQLYRELEELIRSIDEALELLECRIE